MNHIIMQGPRKIGDITIDDNMSLGEILNDLNEILGTTELTGLSLVKIGGGYKVLMGHGKVHILDLVA